MTETTVSRDGAPLWMRITLVASLAVNLLVLGLFVGMALHHRPDGDRRIARDVAAAPFVMALNDRDRRAVIEELRGEPAALRENRRELRARFHALLDAFRAPTFDRAAVEALLAEQREAATTRQGIGERLFLDRIEGMSAADRAAFADRLERSFRKMRRPH